jgi:elongation factor P hydroxylase
MLVFRRRKAAAKKGFWVVGCRRNPCWFFAAVKRQQKKDFGLWVANATHVGTLLPRSGNKKQGHHSS